MFRFCAWVFMCVLCGLWFSTVRKVLFCSSALAFAQIRAPLTCTDNSTNYGDRHSGKIPFLFGHIHHYHLRFLMLHAVYAVRVERTALCRRNQLNHSDSTHCVRILWCLLWCKWMRSHWIRRFVCILLTNSVTFALSFSAPPFSLCNVSSRRGLKIHG